MRDADGRRAEYTRGRIVRQQVEENFRANAHADTAQAHKKESDRREIALTEANGIAGEISVSKKKGVTKSNPDREARAQRFVFAEKEEESFSDSISGIFSKRFAEEKEAPIFADADSRSDRITRYFAESEPDSGSRRDSQANAVRFAFAEKKGSSRHDPGERDFRLRKLSGAYSERDRHGA